MISLEERKKLEHIVFYSYRKNERINAFKEYLKWNPQTKREKVEREVFISMALQNRKELKKIMNDEINPNCKDCNHLDKNAEIEGVKQLCGFALSLAHWQDAKRWPRDKQKTCPIKNLTQKEANEYYFRNR